MSGWLWQGTQYRSCLDSRAALVYIPLSAGSFLVASGTVPIETGGDVGVVGLGGLDGLGWALGTNRMAAKLQCAMGRGSE